MSIENNVSEPTEDDLYLARMTMDEVGADMDENGHVAVTDENRTQDPFTTKGSLANALDEALDYSNPNYDPTNESQGDIDGVTTDPQSPFKGSSEEIKPDDTTMDKAPEVPKTVKDSLTEAFDSVFAMDAVTEVPGEADDEAHNKWEADEIKKNVPQVPESMGGGDQPDSNGLIYLDYTFTVDPAKYNSPNYQPIADAGMIGNNASNAVKNPNEQAANDRVDEEVSVEETIVAAGGEPSNSAEKVAAKEANESEKEVASIGKPIEEKKTEDEATEKVVLDYATFIDGSSFMCFDEDAGIDYTKIAMDAGPKKPVTRQTCKTTFAQCRAKNPLFCRFHGPKLLEKDIKSAISAAVGKGCVVSVTKDKSQKNPLTFRLTIGCPPSMKKNVENIVHMFMTQNPGISSPEEYKDLGNGKQTTEFDMDILRADEPPKKNDLKGQASQWETEKAKAKGKTMPVVGDTPPSIERAVGNGEVKEEVKEEAAAEVPENPIEQQPQNEADVGEKKQNETLQTPVEEVAENPEEKEEEIDEGGNANGEGITEGMIQAAFEKIVKVDDRFTAEDIGRALNGDLAFAEGSLKSVQKALGEDDPIYKKMAEFSSLHDEAEAKGMHDEFWKTVKAHKTMDDKLSAAKSMLEGEGEKQEENVAQPVDSETLEASSKSETPPNDEPQKTEETKSQVKPQDKSAKAKDGTEDEIDAAASSIAEKTGENPSAIAKGIEERIEGKKPTTPEEAKMIETVLPKGSKLAEKIVGAADTEKKDNSSGGDDTNGRKVGKKSRINIPSSISATAKNAIDGAESYLVNPIGEEGLAVASRIMSAAGGLKKLEDKAAAIGKVRRDKGRKTSALGRAILDAAEDAAKSNLDSSVRYIEALGDELVGKTKRERYEAELAAKEKVNDRIDNVLVGTNKMMFTVGKDGKTISDVDGVVRSIVDDLTLFGKELGIEESDVKALIRSDGIGIFGADLKASASDMDEAVSEARSALEKSGADFHIEDAEHLSEIAVKTITKTRSAYETLKSAADRAKAEMAASKRVSEERKKAEQSEDIDIGKVRERIAKVYKEWVEEEVPSWVDGMTDSKAAKYADLLERASVAGGKDYDVLEELDSFERLAKREAARKKSMANSSAKSENADNGSKDEESPISEEARKLATDAAKRLGVDAYKPTEELRKMAIVLKPRSNGNPRLEQRVKDLETILADREAKKDLAPRELGKYVGDESPNRRIVMDLIVEALSKD